METLHAAATAAAAPALPMVKPAIPDGLLINGQNPLSLLHPSLSVGLHTLTDEQCLELATDIRVVLTELADRISRAMQDQKSLMTLSVG